MENKSNQPKDVETPEEMDRAIEEQKEVIETHLHIAGTGLANIGCAEELIAICMVKGGLNQLFVEYMESHSSKVTVEDFVFKTKEMLASLVNEMEQQLKNDMAERALAEKNLAGATSTH